MSTTVVPAQQATPTPSPGRRPAWLRWLVATLLVLVAAFTWLAWGFTGFMTVAANADGFVTGTVPGAVSVQLHPDPWFVYVEGGSTADTITVTGPDGRSVPVTRMSTDVTLDSGRNAVEAARFEVAPGQMGRYRISVTGTSEPGIGGFSVGNFDVAGFSRNLRLAAAPLLLVNVVAAVLFVGLPRRRPKQAPAVPAPRR